MQDATKYTYLAEIETSRKPKTHDAYSVALRYFYECVGNKAMKDIDRGDLLKFAAFLRCKKGQAPRSANNKFENLITFLGSTTSPGRHRRSRRTTGHSTSRRTGGLRAGNAEQVLRGVRRG